jgi:tetratricopeptide (TPR) repeat protein
MNKVITTDKKRTTLIILTGLAVCIIAALIISFAVAGGNDEKLQKQLDLGNKYLEEMDYEQALVAFEAALDIDPMNADAYLGIVEVYIRTNEFEKALEIAKEGYEATGDERLKEKIDMIESGDVFASNGWVMRQSCYDADGKLLFYYQFTYNLKGQKASVTRCDANGVETQHLELTYDEEGRELVSCTGYADDGELIKYVYEYDGNDISRLTQYVGISDEVEQYYKYEKGENGKVSRSVCYSADDVMRYSINFEYDENGNCIKHIQYDENGNMEVYYIFTYDNRGNNVLQQCYRADGELLHYTENIYDEKGNDVEWRVYDGNGNLKSVDSFETGDE